MSVSPSQYYENSKDGVMLLTCARIVGTVANDQLVVTGVANKRIRILGMVLSSSGAAGITFKSASGGTANFGVTLQTGVPFLMPIADPGYFECTTSNSLYVDVGTAVTIINVFYIIYTPT